MFITQRRAIIVKSFDLKGSIAKGIRRLKSSSVSFIRIYSESTLEATTSTSIESPSGTQHFFKQELKMLLKSTIVAVAAVLFTCQVTGTLVAKQGEPGMLVRSVAVDKSMHREPVQTYLNDSD